MKRVLSLFVAVFLAVEVRAQEESVIKDPCLKPTEYDAALFAAVKAQNAESKKAKENGSLPEAARLTPFRWVEAHHWNAAAYEIIKDISKNGPPEDEDATDYYASASVRTDAQDALEFLRKAQVALDSASDCATAGTTTEQIKESMAKCQGYISKNKLYLERVLGLKKWPKKSEE